MIEDFIIANWIEIIGVLISLIYLYFSIKQKILLWPFGILSAIFYIIIYFNFKFYADMGLQVYYFFISIYGWIIWTSSDSRKSNRTDSGIRNTTKTQWLLMAVIALVIWGLLFWILKEFTDSDIPGWDALTTSASIVATWMLARKLLEHWLLWIVIDLISMVLYIYKGLFPTTVLFAVYTIMAVVGYSTWRKKMKQ